MSYENDYAVISKFGQELKKNGFNVSILIADFFGPNTDDFAKQFFLENGYPFEDITDFGDELWLCGNGEGLIVDVEYLKNLELAFGNTTTINKLIYTDYHISRMNHNRKSTQIPEDSNILLKFIELVFKKIEKLLAVSNPDFIFTIGNNHFIKNAVFSISQLRKIPCLCLYHNRLGLGGSILENFWVGPSNLILDEQQRLRNSQDPCTQADKYINRIKYQDVPAYDNDGAFNLRASERFSFLHNLRLILNRFLAYPRQTIVTNLLNYKRSRKKRQNLYQEKPFFTMAYYMYIRKIFIITKFFSNKKFHSRGVPKQPFILITLHVIPEAGVFAQPKIVNEFDIVKRLARIVPIDYLILVKPNPQMLLLTCDVHDNRYYQELADLPNVRIVSIHEPSIKYIKHAKAIVSLAGTSLLEAALNGKPAFALTEPEFLGVDGVYRFEEEKFLNQIEKHQLSETNNHKYYVQAMLNFGIDSNFLGYQMAGTEVVETTKFNQEFLMPLYERFFWIISEKCSRSDTN